jgi:2-polyprenyl-3-methyl-5-hydroxy-6-metoxy-1,4-benzoquinol methylase
MPRAVQYLPDANSLGNDNGVDIEIYQCSGCGLVQLSSDPVPYYREVIRASAISKAMKEFRLTQFGDVIDKFDLTGKKVLEVGCGRGEYLSLIKQFNVDAYGLEYSVEAVKQCVKSGLNVSKGFIRSNNSRLRYAPFNAFFILNFLEHLPDPNSILRGIYNNMGEDAVGLVEVPNFDMILRNRLFAEFTADHLLYFTKETLSSTLSHNGFEIIECNEEWDDYILSAVVKKREKIDFSDFNEQQAKIIEEVTEYINRFKKVAIWGAGHQAFAVISLLNLTGKIKYVVDSAVFKQGKFTPATHIPIVSPEVLNTDPVDAVIVMAAGYSDEVAGIIRQKFDKKINVAILRDYGLEILYR